MKSIRELQARLGVTPDGMLGPKTWAALAAALDAAPKPDGLPPHFHAIAAHLEIEEGREASAYQDSRGYWTIGVGRLIDARKGGRLTNDEIDYLLANDIRAAVDQLETFPALAPAWAAVRDNPARATALVSMCFQLGARGLSDFKTTLSRVVAGDFAGAADSAARSLWAAQTPNRAARVCALLRTGKL